MTFNQGNTWSQVYKLFASNPAANALFGSSVNLFGDIAIVTSQESSCM